MIAKLPPQTEDEIQRLVDTGEFDGATDVLVQGVRLLGELHEQTAHLRELLQVGIDQHERGEFREYSQELLDDRWESALKQYNAGQLKPANVRS